MVNNKIIRATILEEELIEEYEQYLFDSDKNERQVVKEALQKYLEDQ